MSCPPAEPSTVSVDVTPPAPREAEVRPAAAVAGRRTRFGRGHRLRRKLRRFRNELRAMLAERNKAGAVLHDPVALNLNTTTICNLRCTMCQQSVEDIPQQVMDHALYARVRDELFDRVSDVSLSVMGEPFCVPDAFMDELLDDMERYDLRLEITTNATRFGTDEELERVVRLTNRLVISCDGATRETFERIRRPGKWDTFTANVERIARIRRSLPFRVRPLLYFSYVLQRGNLDELTDFVDLAAGWGAYSITVSPLIDVDPSLGDDTIDVAEPCVREVLREAKERAFARGVGLSIEGPDAGPPARRGPWGPRRLLGTLRQAWIPFRPTLTRGITYLIGKVVQRFRVAGRECPYLWNKAFIQMDGEVSTCCHPDFLVAGHVGKQSVGEIWRGKVYRGIRTSLNTEHPPAPCRDCHLLRR